MCFQEAGRTLQQLRKEHLQILLDTEGALMLLEEKEQ